jgi:hypothetical protein
MPLRTKIQIVLSVLAAIPVAALALLVVLGVFEYFLLEKPSAEGKCGNFMLGRAEPHPRVAKFRGEVVGKNLYVLQYRWLRRSFIPVGTKLSLLRELPSTEYQGNVIRHAELAGEVVIGKSGRFDFGDLKPGEYEVRVTYPADYMTGFGFVIDPATQSSEVLIDASPNYYCDCCGSTFELH